VARLSDLSPARLAAIVAAVSGAGLAASRWNLEAGVATLALGTTLVAWRHGRLLRRQRRRRVDPAVSTESVQRPQHRLDAPPPQTGRLPVLSAGPEQVDWKELRKSQEQETGAALGAFLEFVRRALGCRTIALFFPGNDGGVVLRAAASDRDGLRLGEKIAPGDGLLGTLLKPDAPAAILEPLLPESTRDLGIYEPGTGPVSLAVARVQITGRPGLALADRDEPLPEGIFEDLAETASAADLLLSRTRDLRSEMRGREVWQRLGRFERSMGSSEREEVVHEELRHFLLQSMAAEAVFFLLPEPGTATPSRQSDRWHARVAWTLGTGCDAAREFRVEVPGRSIAAGILSRGEILQRHLAPRESVPLLGMGEPVLPLEEGGEILGAPVSLGVEGRPGMALLYRRKEPFSIVEREILQTALSSFGQALTRLRVLQELEKLATRDGLTGLVNHRTFQSSFRRELLKARRTGAKVAMILTDIDFFKKVNDQHGHPAGDAVLRSVASTVRSQLRDEVDIVARYGGEEFALVLVGTTESGAMETAERVRRAVEESGTDIGEPVPKKVTISLGVAVFPDDGGTAEELIERTDQALYRAKNGGRNRAERALSISSRAQDPAI
jgi:diguanylate cyclase (GGDEF)-like protein